MKVLYIGHYKEGTGWSQAAIDYILALDAAGVDVACRAIKLNNNYPILPARITELETKSSRGCDINIQHVLPHLMDYNGHFKKNIGMFIAETYNLKYTGWPSRLNTMDEIWIPNIDMHITCNNSGITKLVKLVPHATDITKFDKQYPEYKLPQEIKTRYKFYFIGENVRRKHLLAAFIAYYKEFTRNDNVIFIIKTHRSGQNPNECMNEIQNSIKDVKKAMRVYDNDDKYAPDCIITDHISEEQIYSLHQQCDCLINPSFGEAWHIPSFDAMGFGKDVISSNCGGMKDFLKGKKAHLINGTLEPVVAHEEIFKDMHNSLDLWYNISISQLARQMRECYNNRNRKYEIDPQIATKAHIEQYSYQNVGNLMKEFLHG